MADVNFYLSAYPKSFLTSFGLNCPNGHPYAEYKRIDTAGTLRCRKCLTLANRRYEARRRAAKAAK